MQVWLDDQLRPPLFNRLTGEKVEWVWAKTFQEAIDYLSSGQVTEISFDHDLAEEKTGYDVACWIEREAEIGRLTPIHYQIHSGNTVGAGKIDAAMKSAWRFWDKTIKGTTNREHTE